MLNDILFDLQQTVTGRRDHPTVGSYTVELLNAGEDEIVKKIGEEAVEVIIAAKGQGNPRVIEECADLLYHLTVLLVSRDLGWEDIATELAQRQRSAPNSD